MSDVVAWYTMTNGIQVQQASTDGVIVTNTKVVLDNVNLAHVLAVTPVSAQTVDGLARYNESASGTTAVGTSNASTVKLSTGYIDSAGAFHGINGDGTRILFSTLTVKVSIDWGIYGATGYSDHGWTKDTSDSTDKTKWTYKDSSSGISYSESDVLNELKKNTLTVYAKESSSSRLRFFKTTALSGNGYLSGFASSDKSQPDTANNSVDYISLGTINLSSLAESSEHTSNAGKMYYIYGGDDGTNSTTLQDDRDAASVSGSIDLFIKTTTYSTGS